MKNISIIFLSVLFLSLFQTSRAQVTSEREKLFPFISNQISIGDTSICILRDNLRMNNKARFFSVFLLYGDDVADSLSLDSITVSYGAKPKSLFIWKTQRGNLACLEYLLGSGNGVSIETPTDLLIFDISERKLKLLGIFSTNSTYSSARTGKEKFLEVRSGIFQHSDTLYIARTAWSMSNINKQMIFKHVFDKVTRIYWNGAKVSATISSEPVWNYLFRVPLWAK